MVGPHIGQGSYGIVRKGYNLDTDEPLAIKFLKDEYVKIYGEEFIEQARKLQGMQHSNVINIKAVHMGDRPYIIMDYAIAISFAST